MTPDGKYAVTRTLMGGASIFFVVRIHEDGKLEYLPNNDYNCSGQVSDIAFIPPQKSEADSSWNRYE